MKTMQHFLALLAILFLALLLMHYKYYVATLRKDILKYRQEIVKSRKEQQLLAIEWETLRAPQRLESAAASLALKPIEKKQCHFLQLFQLKE